MESPRKTDFVIVCIFPGIAPIARIVAAAAVVVWRIYLGYEARENARHRPRGPRRGPAPSRPAGELDQISTDVGSALSNGQLPRQNHETGRHLRDGGEGSSVTDRVRNHPLYGPIPLVAREYAWADGKTYEWLEPDPAFRPPLPDGAVRGDPSRQVYCSAFHTPKYFYVDEERECVECGVGFVFEAKEQRFWYEQLQFNLNSVAIRCRPCRAKRRKAAEYGRQIGISREKVKESPEDPTPYLDLAEGLVRQHQITGEGKLQEAVWAARQARRLWPSCAEGEFWEGLAQWLSGQREQGTSLLKGFTEHPAVVRRRFRAMVAEARGILQGQG